MHQGQTSLMLNFNVAGFAPAMVSDGLVTKRRNGAQRGPLSAMVVMGGYFYSNLTLWISHAFIDNMEVGAILGIRTLGGSLRLGLVDEDLGEHLSIAASLAGGWQPLEKHPWGHVGVDVSKHTLDSLTFFSSAYLSYAREAHAFGALTREKCNGFGQPGCGEMGPSLHHSFKRKELRLYGSLGLSILNDGPDGGHQRFSIALQPYKALHLENIELDNCRACKPITTYEEPFGALLTFNTELISAL